MALFGTTNSNGGTPQNLSSTYKTIVALYAATATLTNGRIYDLMIGTVGTPSDGYVEWDISRTTDATTGATATALTPRPLDPVNRAAGTASTGNHTVEPTTVTASSSMFYLGINSRASYRWVAAPGSELLWPATNLNGLVMRARANAYSLPSSATVYHSE